MLETAAPWQPELIQALVPVALPSPASPSPLLSGSCSPPTPCQAASALLTGNKTNLTIKSELVLVFFFSPGTCAETAQRRADGVPWLAGESGQEGTAGGGMVAGPARAPLQCESHQGSWERGWEGEPATATLISLQL